MTITSITEQMITTETELAELLVKILHRLDRQVQQAEFLKAENAELRKRVEKLEQGRKYDVSGCDYTLDTSSDVLPIDRAELAKAQTRSTSHPVLNAAFAQEPVHSSTARKS